MYNTLNAGKGVALRKHSSTEPKSNEQLTDKLVNESHCLCEGQMPWLSNTAVGWCGTDVSRDLLRSKVNCDWLMMPLRQCYPFRLEQNNRDPNQNMGHLSVPTIVQRLPSRLRKPDLSNVLILT